MRSLLLFLLFASTLEAKWHDRKSEGWAWYEDRQVEDEKEQKETESPKQTIDSVRQEIDESLSLAILNPTPENIETYIRLQKEWVDRSKLFALVWKRTLLENPDLDPSATYFPTSHYGRLLQKSLEENQKRDLIHNLSKNHGLFFFFDKNLPSKAFAKVVKKFSEKHVWETIAVSTDGSKTKSFGTPLQDNGISQRFGVSVTPALYIVDTATKQHYPIAYGLATLEGIENNILLIFNKDLQ